MSGVNFSPRVKSKYIVRCSVEGCHSNSNKDLSICFHNFPQPNECVVYVENYFGVLEKIDKLKAWQRKLKVKNVTRKKKVCSLHFKVEDYILPGIATKKQTLKRNAVPSVNLPNSTLIVEKYNARLQRRFERSQRQKKENNVQVEVKTLVEYADEGKNAEENGPCLMESEIMKEIDEEIIETVSAPLVKEIGVQVKSDDIACQFMNYVKNERDLSTVTGINSFKTLNCIVEMIKLACGNTLCHSSIKMSLYDKVVMTYLKLRQNLSYRFLALLFHCYSDTHCRRIVYSMLHMLSETLKVAITWPSRYEILKNMPLCFEDFEDVRVVIDCTEVFIQEPKNLCCQVITHSNYKKAHTGKIMTGVAPDGSIIYLSKVWGGRASDSAIFENSDIIHLLESGDAIMADKRFTIDEICAKNNWKLIRPPILKDKKQFSKSQSIMAVKIAKARVHVDRSNQRIKAFKILREKMPAQLVPHLENIFNIICGTINLTSPILKDDQFMKQL